MSILITVTLVIFLYLLASYIVEITCNAMGAKSKRGATYMSDSELCERLRNRKLT